MVAVSRWLKVVTWFAAVVVLVLVAGLGSAYWTIHRAFPQVDGTLTIKGLSAPVQVLRDASGIPEIYADTPADLFLAQGYVQAQDQFFEMDFRRHVTSGTLTELFGSDALKTDMFV